MDYPCNCPDGTFPYEVTRGDIGDNEKETELNIAYKFGLVSKEVFEAETKKFISENDYSTVEGAVRTYNPGDILCIPGTPPASYRNPCEVPELSIIDIEQIDELFAMIDYAETLALVAENEALIANQETFTENAEGFLTQNDRFVSDLKRDIIYIACQSNYPDAAGRIYQLTGIYYTNDEMSTFCDGLSASGLPAGEFINPLERASAEEVADLMALRDSVLYWAREHGSGYLADYPYALNEETGAEESLLRLSQQTIIQYDTAVRADDAVAQEAQQKREELLAKVEALRPILAEWRSIKGEEQALLTQLDAKITTMSARNVIADVYVGDFVDQFQRYYDNMQARHTQMAQLDDMIDFKQIDWLRLTPDERREASRQQIILDRLADAQIPISFGTYPKDPARFDQLVQAALRRALLDPTLRGNVIAQGFLSQREAERFFGADYGSDYASQVPHGGAMLSATVFANMDTVDPTAIDDPLESERFWNTVEQGIDTAFFVAGFIPVVGTFIDLADAVIALAEGDYSDAALSVLFAAIDINDLLRLADRMDVLADTSEGLLRLLPADAGSSTVDDIGEFRRARQNQIAAIRDKNPRFREATQQISAIVGERVGWTAPSFRNLSTEFNFDAKSDMRERRELIKKEFKASNFPNNISGFEKFILQHSWGQKALVHFLPSNDHAVEVIKGLELKDLGVLYKNVPIEIGAIFDGDRLVDILVGTIKIPDLVGMQSRSSFRAFLQIWDSNLLKGNTLTHYHFTGGPFSSPDIKTTLHAELQEIRAVGALYTYSYSPSKPLRDYLQGLEATQINEITNEITSSFLLQQDKHIFSQIVPIEGMNLKTEIEGTPSEPLIGDKITLRTPFEDLEGSYIITITIQGKEFSEILNVELS